MSTYLLTAVAGKLLACKDFPRFVIALPALLYCVGRREARTAGSDNWPMNDKTVGLTGVSTSAAVGSMSPIIAVPSGSISFEAQFSNVAMSIDGPTRSEINDFIGKS